MIKYQERLWWALRKKNVEEEHIKMIQNIYEGCATSVRTILGSTERFNVKLGFQQGSALSPLLFITVMDVISEDHSMQSCYLLMT